MEEECLEIGNYLGRRPIKGVGIQGHRRRWGTGIIAAEIEVEEIEAANLLILIAGGEAAQYLHVATGVEAVHQLLDDEEVVQLQGVISDKKAGAPHCLLLANLPVLGR